MNSLRLKHPRLNELYRSCVNQLEEFQLFNRNSPQHQLLKEYLTALTNRQYCQLTASGTDALDFARQLAESRVVAMPDCTYVGTLNPFLRAGCEIIPVDVTRDGLMDLDCLHETLEQRPDIDTVVIVQLFGNMVNCEHITSLKEKFRFTLIEDAAQSLGSEQNAGSGHRWVSGGVGDISCFSFDPLKPCGAIGHGGAVMYNVVANWVTDPMHSFPTYQKSDMSTLDALFVFLQMEYMREFQAERLEIVDRYKRELSDVCEFMQPATLFTQPSWSKCNVTVGEILNSPFMPTEPLQSHYRYTTSYCLNRHVGLGGLTAKPMARWRTHRNMTLPCYEWLIEEDIQLNIDSAKKLLDNASRFKGSQSNDSLSFSKSP